MARRLLARSHDEGADRVWDGAVGGRAGQYGKLYDIALGRGDYVHRIAYRAFVGPIPDGLTIDHVWARGCRSSLCINPRHLEAVPGAENSRRLIDARPDRCVRGHAWTDANTYTRPSGQRFCRRCHADSERARRRHAT